MVGTVSDNAGQTIAGATVIALTPEGRTQATTTTNSAGAFVFSGLSAGNYVLQVFAAGFGPSRMITVTLGTGQNVTQDIRMDIGFATPAGPRQQGRQPASNGEPISLNLRTDIQKFFALMAELADLEADVDPSLSGTVTIRLTDVPWSQALDIVTRNYNLTHQVQGNRLRIGRNPASAQDKIVLQVDLYKNGVSMASPQIALLNMSKGSLSFGAAGVTLSLTPDRVGADRVAIDIEVSSGGLASRAHLVTSSNEPQRFAWTSGPDNLEARFTIVSNK
jgi:hypothetical protein